MHQSKDSHLNTDTGNSGQHVQKDLHDTSYPLAADSTGGGDPELIERYEFSIHGHDSEKKAKCRNFEISDLNKTENGDDIGIFDNPH
jgi:hypothetical protein